MQDLSRVNLYRRLADELEKEMKDTWEYQVELQKIIKVLKTNIFILDGVERRFVIGHVNELSNNQNLKDFIRERIKNVDDSGFRQYLETNQRKRPNVEDKTLSFIEFLDKKENIDDSTLFIRLLDVLHNYSEQVVGKIEKEFYTNILERYFEYPLAKTKVFLSYAYKDKLYTWALYHYMRIRGIDLYVDWMHTEALSNGAQLKVSLQKALSDSKQFLFLRTSNSELGKPESKQIRSWCSWEFGNFYGPASMNAEERSNEKYYIQIYSNDVNNSSPRKTLKPSKPSIIDGLKRLSDINEGKLVG